MVPEKAQQEEVGTLNFMLNIRYMRVPIFDKEASAEKDETEGVSSSDA